MKTLLQINTNTGYNAPGRLVNAIDKTARNAGWCTHIAYGRKLDSAKHHDFGRYNIGTRRGVCAHALMTRLTDRHGLYSRHSTRRLLEYIGSISPDIIHLHNLHGYYLHYPMLMDRLKTLGLPVVWTLHDNWALTGHCAYFDTAACDKWRTHCHRCPLTKDYPSSLFADASRNNHALKKKHFAGLDNLHLVTVSQWHKEIVSQSFLGHYPIHVIPNGIELPPPPGAKSPSPLVLAVASQWDNRKGLDHIEALRRRLPPEINMRVIGRTRRPLSRGIEHIHRIDNPATLNNHYAQAWVMVNPSRAETLSMVNIEAQANGTPVAAYANGGMPQTLCPSQSTAVAPGDIGQLALAVMQLLDRQAANDIDRDTLRSFVNSQFSATANITRYLQLYQGLTNPK